MPNGFSDTIRVFTKIYKLVYAYNQPPWMTDNIKMSLKQSCKLTIFFLTNGKRKSDLDKILEKSAKFLMLCS